jgi:hypothetical protein
VSARATFSEERGFGRTVGLVLLALAAWFGYRQGRWPIAAPAGVVGALLVMLAFAAPRLLVWPNRAWMALAHALGFVSTHVILGVLFLAVVTPLGWLLRLRGKDPLARRGAPSASYWVPYPDRHRDPRYYEKLF